MSERFRVVLVDDHAIVRGGVKAMLRGTEFEVVGEAASGDEGIAVVQETTPELVLLDIRMAGGDGFSALVAIKAALPKTVVLMLSTYDNPTYMARAVAGGAAGYLLKGIDHETLLEAMRAVLRGEQLLSTQDLIRSLRVVGESVQAADLIEPLTRREEEVLKLVATGLPNREIAGVLFISEGTVKTHVEHIIGKLGVSDRVQAAVWAARQGLVSEADLPKLSTHHPR
ncbi:response regulator [Armatimonas rosea]|uniref:DNA-binding NarL/FixJ family response regulator n=1 Tax=Armatimonas rosea TaxID=685828 RepID=A0A7W9SQX8_ARMRO|nr:response regulator transcription factor [Armatimonas rosea]MBB6051141.1 DNA-binding NarL/FixJ family response regulator [Armatimonas rosea]